MRATDLERLIALDRAHVGESRRGFFEKRWQAMGREPEAFISIAAERDGEVVGHLCAHLLDGEFGGEARVAVMDAVAVDSAARGSGVGRALVERLVEEARALGAHEIRTQARWDQRGLLDFFARSGFRLAARVVLERETAVPEW